MDPKKVQKIMGVGRSREEVERINMPCAAVYDEVYRRRYVVNLLVAIFGIGSSVTMNGIGPELPLLVKSAPEGSALPANLAIAVVVAYVGPALYALFKKSATPLRISHEFTWITSVLLLGTVTMGLVAFFHDVTITFNGVERSTVMLIFVFILGTVSASRNVLLMPYLKNVEEVNLTSFFIGEGLSGFVPSIVALIQGVGGDPVCPSSTTDSTDQPYILPPKFSSRNYFLFVAALVAASTGSFWLLEYLRVPTPSRKEDETFDDDPDSVKEHSSSEKLLDHGATEKTREFELMDAGDLASTDPGVASKPGIGSTNTIYLCTLMWLACLASHGYLNTLEAYSARPYGNSAYHLVANLSQVAGTATYALAFWIPPISARRITGIMGFVMFATAYVTWLALCSPMPPWRGTTHGTVLLIIVWIILISLVSYAKLAITAIVWQQTSDAGLYQLGFANLTGTICSAVLIFSLVNFTDLFTPYAACELHS